MTDHRRSDGFLYVLVGFAHFCGFPAVPFLGADEITERIVAN